MIGILGGTFDPIHHGHLRVALDALEALDLQEVRLLPLGQAVHREQPHASPGQRLAMLERAIQGQPGLVADPREIERTGGSFMVDTLESLRADLPNQTLCLLLGGDAFNGFMHWRKPEQILQLAQVLVMQRPGYRLPDDAELQALVAQHRCNSLQAMQQNHCGLIYFQTVTQLDISSSDIRRRFACAKDPAFLLPRAVTEYIREQGLYRD